MERCLNCFILILPSVLGSFLHEHPHILFRRSFSCLATFAMKTTLLLTSVAALLGTASASVHAVREVLLARQSATIPSISSSDIPSQCQSKCSPMTQIDTCFSCLISIVPSIQSSMDTAEQAFVDGCKAAGVDVGSFSSSGSSSGSASGSAKAGGSATGTGSSASSSSTDSPFAKNAAFAFTSSLGAVAGSVFLVAAAAI
ncbi:hypothetical protein DL96DRAFT_1617983 [Flagelloscypha sp. PMI_526]|nr:hypothetical protein DL96DRAFT_1617983 [Flagelloscypha sp. PMI_526]